MLPPSPEYGIEEFFQALKQLQKTADEAGNLEGAALDSAFQELHQIFTSLILSTSDNDSNGVRAPRLQSILTEIHRQMRLLQMDVAFLQASSQSATAMTRQVTMSDRIKTLISYCQAFRQVQ